MNPDQLPAGVYEEFLQEVALCTLGAFLVSATIAALLVLPRERRSARVVALLAGSGAFLLSVLLMAHAAEPSRLGVRLLSIAVHSAIVLFCSRVTRRAFAAFLHPALAALAAAAATALLLELITSGPVAPSRAIHLVPIGVYLIADLVRWRLAVGPATGDPRDSRKETATRGRKAPGELPSPVRRRRLMSCAAGAVSLALLAWFYTSNANWRYQRCIRSWAIEYGTAVAHAWCDDERPFFRSQAPPEIFERSRMTERRGRGEGIEAWLRRRADGLRGWLGTEPVYDGEGLGTWIARFESPDAEVRRRALDEAAFLFGPSAKAALPVLLRVAAEETDPLAAAQALRAVASAVGPEDENVAAAVAPLLAHPDAGVVAAAAKVVGRLGAAATPALPALMKAYGKAKISGRGDIRRALRALGPHAASAARALAAGTATAHEARDVVAILAALDEGGLAPLAYALHLAPADSAPVLAAGLAQLPRANPALVFALEAGSPSERSAVLAALSAPGVAHREMAAILGVELADASSPTEARGSAARALRNLGPDAAAALPALERLLGARRDGFRPRAAQVAAAIGAAAAPMLPSLRISARETSGWTAKEFQKAIAAVASARDGDLPEAYLVHAARPERSYDPTLNEAVAERYATISRALLSGDPQGVSIGLSAIREFGPHAREHLPLLLGFMENRYRRYDAVKALGSLGPAGAPAVPKLQTLLQEESAQMRAVAAEALGRIGTPAAPAVARLIELFPSEHPDDQRVVAVALGRIGAPADSAIPLLLDTLDAEVLETRVAAMSGLVEFGARALPALRAHLEQPDALVRRRVEIVIERIHNGAAGAAAPTPTKGAS